MVDIRQWVRNGGHDKAKLISTTLTAPGVVLFDYNPNKISFQRNAITRNSGNADKPKRAISSELSRIQVSDVVLEGADTKARCDMLLGWATPPTGALAKFVASVMFLDIELPQLTFQWGPPVVGFFYQVKLKSCDIAYERFGEDGEPSRARVTLTLEEQPSLLGTQPTNPTSGGVAGRSAHQMCEGENLAMVATRQLGDPRQWRALARANSLDDPLRVKPGTAIYVPNPRELEKKGS